MRGVGQNGSMVVDVKEIWLMGGRDMVRGGGMRSEGGGWIGRRGGKVFIGECSQEVSG